MTNQHELYLGKNSYSVLGRRPVRHDGADKVTGKAVYTADWRCRIWRMAKSSAAPTRRPASNKSIRAKR